MRIEGSNPSLTARLQTPASCSLSLPRVRAHVSEMRTCSTGGARSAWIKIPPLRSNSEPSRNVLQPRRT